MNQKWDCYLTECYYKLLSYFAHEPSFSLNKMHMTDSIKVDCAFAQTEPGPIMSTAPELAFCVSTGSVEH